MAKLSTPYHACQQPYTANGQGVTAHCPFAAYRKVDGRWLCRTHGRQARARAARPPMFEVVGIVTTSDPIYAGDIFARIEATQRNQS